MIKPTFSSVFDLPVFQADASAFNFDSFILDGNNEVTNTISWSDPTGLVAWLESMGVTGIDYSYTASSLRLVITKSFVKVSGFYFSFNIPNATVVIFVEDSNIQVAYAFNPAVTRGCTDADATNYNAVAAEDDGSCLFVPETDEEKLINCLAGKKYHRLHTLGQPISDDEKRIIRYLTFVADITERYANAGGVLQNAIPASGSILATDIIPTLGIQYYITANFTHDGIIEQVFNVLVNTTGMSQSDFLDEMVNAFVAAPFGMTAEHDGTELTVHAPEGTGVQYNGASLEFLVDAPGQASFFDLSPYADPNVNDIRVDVLRLTTPSSTNLADLRVDSEGLTIAQWVAQIGAAIGGGGYSGGASGDDLGVLEPSVSSDTGNAQLRIYEFQYPVNVFDLQPIPTPTYAGGVDISSFFAYLLSSSGVTYLVTSDDINDIGVTGLSTLITRPINFPSSTANLYGIDHTDGRFFRVQIVVSSPLAYNEFFHGASFASGDHGDVCYDPIGNRIWGMSGLKYARISTSNTVTVSSSTAPDDDYLICNTATGATYSFAVGGSVLSLLADSGALTTVDLAATSSGILIAGRIGFLSGSFYVPKQGTRRIYVFNSSLVATAFIDLATFTGNSVTSNVKHVFINDGTIFVQHTDDAITVIKSGVFVCTFFAAAGTRILNTRNVSGSKLFIIDDAIYRVDTNAQIVLNEPFSSIQTSADFDFADGIDEQLLEEGDLCLTPTEYNNTLQNALQLCQSCQP